MYLGMPGPVFNREVIMGDEGYNQAAPCPPEADDALARSDPLTRLDFKF